MSEKPAKRATLQGFKNFIDTLAFSPDGKILAAGGDGPIRLWNLEQETPRRLAVFTGHTRAITSLAFSRDGRMLASCSGHSDWDKDRTVRLWDVLDRTLLQTLEMPGPVQTVALAPDGQHLVTLNTIGTVYVLRLAASPGGR